MSGDINVQSFSGKVNISNNLLVGSSHLFVDTVNNRVGITTASPDAGLHVNSNAYVHTDFRVGSGIVMNDTNGRITAGSFVGDGSGLDGINSDSGSWVNGTNSNVHLATLTDKVGIGTTDPEAQLHIGPKDNDHIYLASANNNYGWKIDTDDQGNGAVPFRIIKRTDDVDTTVLTIKNQDGNVGIGTVSPSDKLHIYGSPMIQHDTVYDFTNNQGWYKIGVWDPTSNTGSRLKIKFLGMEGYSSQGIARGGETILYASCNNNVPNTKANIDGRIHAYGNPAITEVKFVHLDGSRHKFEIRAYIKTYVQMSMTVECTQTQSFTKDVVASADPGADSPTVSHAIFTHVVDNSGNVGIGTTSPLRKFHIVSGVGDTSANWISGVFGGSGDYPRVVLGSLSTYACVGSHNSALNGWADLYLNNPTNPVVVKPTGKVGIGVTDPQSLLQVPRPAVAYDKVIQLGTQTTYADGDLYSLGFGGNALMGMGLATGTRSVFGRQGMATHIPNTETWGIYTNSWTKLINVDGSTRRVYFGHTDKFNLFYAPTNWSYSTTSTSETNLWTFDVSIPQDGYLIVSSNGHWSNDTANKWVYAKIGVDSADPADTSGFYDSFTGGGASTNGGDFHGYKDSSVSWQDFNWSGTLKVSAGTRTICMRVKVSGGTLSLNGTAVNMLYIPKNYF
jgi:hypothetical protein